VHGLAKQSNVKGEKETWRGQQPDQRVLDFILFRCCWTLSACACYTFWRFPPTLSFLELRFIFLFYYFHVHAAAAGALEPMSETCVVRVCPLTDEMTPHTFPKEKKSFFDFLIRRVEYNGAPALARGCFFSFLSLNSFGNMAARRLQKALFSSIGNLIIYIFIINIERGGEGSPADSSKQQRHTKTRTVLSVCCRCCCCWPALLL
jgi:hypothetical protein